MNCQEAKAFFDQPDDPALRSHLSGCRACSHELACWQQMNELLADMPRVQAPVALFDSIMKVVEVAPFEKPRPFAGIDWVGSGGLALAGASLAVFVLNQLPRVALLESLTDVWPIFQQQVFNLARDFSPNGAIAQGLLWSVVGLAIAFTLQEATDLVPVSNKSGGTR